MNTSFEDEKRKLKKYASEYIDPVIKPLVDALLRKQPIDVLSFSLTFLAGMERRPSTDGVFPVSAEPHLVVDENSDSRRMSSGRRRTGVSSEAISVDVASLFEAVVVPKSKMESREISDVLSNQLLFGGLDTAQMQAIVDAVVLRTFKKGDTIIKQGDEGDYFYILKSGSANCFVDEKLVDRLDKGRCFGEVALMYNGKRTATIVATTDVETWALERTGFRMLLMRSHDYKKKRQSEFLKRMPILSNLTDQEFERIVDALQERNFEDGEYAVRQGDPGDCFHIVTKGRARVYKTYDGNQEVKKVELEVLKEGDYFGEVALLRSEPRNASVIADGSLTTVFLDRNAFTRLLGPVAEVLQRKTEDYDLVEKIRYQESLEAIRRESSEKSIDEDIESTRRNSASNQRRRTAVSSEPMGELNLQMLQAPLKMIDKPEKSKSIIRSALAEHFLFKDLPEDRLATVIGAMEIREFSPGDVLMRQGDQGDYMYVTEEGNADCIVTSQEGDNLVRVFGPGEAFGALALMYMAPRTASIVATTRLKTWALDRNSFRSVLTDAGSRERKNYDDVLKSIPMLQYLNASERSGLADALQEKTYSDGQYIITQGAPGDCFFILVEGEARVTRKYKNSSNSREIYKYKAGDYFGELALRDDKPPRAANVIAIGDVKVAALDKPSFQRLLGPLSPILNRNIDSYKVLEAEYTAANSITDA